MKKQLKRYMALVLTFALVFAIPFAFTQEASAAAKKSKKSNKVTLYMIKESTVVDTDFDGKTSTQTWKYTINKKGLTTKATWSGTNGKGKMVYKRNGKGQATQIKTYNEKNKLTGLTKNTYKKGKLTVSTDYSVKGKKKTKIYVSKYYYKGKTLIRIDWQDLVNKDKGSYDPTKPDPEDNSTVKYDSYGNEIERVRTETGTEDGVTYTDTWKTVHKYTYDSHGNILKDEETSTSTYTSGEYTNTYTTSSVSTYKYKAVKLSKKDFKKYYS